MINIWTDYAAPPDVPMPWWTSNRNFIIAFYHDYPCVNMKKICTILT